MTTFLLLIACGIVGGLLFFFLHIPGGAMLGAVVAVLAVKMLGHVETDTPHLFQLGAQIAIGVMVGNMMTGGTLLEIRAMAPLMFGSTALLVVAGALGAWFICRSAGLDAGSAILATSPGGLQAVVGMASDLGTNAPAVLAFHLVRLYTVLLLAPFLGWLLHRLLPHSLPAIKKRPGRERPLPGRIATVLRQRRAAYHQNSAGTPPPLPYRMP